VKTQASRWDACTKLSPGKVGQTTGSREVIWEGISIAQLRLKNAAGTETERRTFHAGGEVRVAGAVTTTLLHTGDHLGSIRELVDASTGAIRARYDYDPYGKRTKLSGDLEADQGYTGHYEHAASGLTLAPFRAYDCVLGRWISRDPIEEAGGLNLYGYVGGNPIRYTDPSGEFAWIPVMGAAWAIYEVGSAIWDAYDTAKTIMDPNKTGTQKFTAGCLFAASVVLPGGGYSKLDDIADAGAGACKAAKGGRLGNNATRKHVDDVATELESRGWTITGGGGRFPEEYLPGVGGGRKGSSFADITATKKGKVLRINTVDTKLDGLTPTKREATNAARIRAQTGGHLLLVPKPK
jgi:RHS repeat-associated protein